MRWTSWTRRAAPGAFCVGAISRRGHAASLDASLCCVARRSTLLIGCGTSQAPKRPGASCSAHRTAATRSSEGYLLAAARRSASLPPAGRKTARPCARLHSPRTPPARSVARPPLAARAPATSSSADPRRKPPLPLSPPPQRCALDTLSRPIRRAAEALRRRAAISHRVPRDVFCVRRFVPAFRSWG